MIDGITILHKAPVMVIKSPWDVIFAMATICFVFSVILAILLQKDFFYKTAPLLMAVMLVIAVIHPEEPSGRYQYEVKVDEYVTVGDLTDRYQIIKHHDDIWFLEDKEYR